MKKAFDENTKRLGGEVIDYPPLSRLRGPILPIPNLRGQPVIFIPWGGIITRRSKYRKRIVMWS